MKGCTPSPTVGLEKMLRRKFEVCKVDEYKTSKVCNRCKNELSTYKKRDGKNSYSRLCCHGCRSKNKLSKRFVDRDLKAAANILLAGTSSVRPLSMSRPKAGCVRKRASPSIGSLRINISPSVRRDHQMTRFLPLPRKAGK
jgi:transposase